MNDIFDYFLTQLNDNASSLVYKGNYIFKFHQDSMSVYETVTGKLVKEEIEYSPVSLITKTPVTFVENNKRIDWLVEFGIAVRIEGQEYDADDDLDYANIVSVLTSMQNASLSISGKKYSIKTDPEPTYQGYSMLGQSKYAILSVTMNVTEVIQGYFGQDWTIEIDDTEVDFTECNISSTKRFVTVDDKDELLNDYNKPIGRTMVWELTLNYNDESELLTEVMGTATLSDTYTLSMVFGTTTWTYTVTCESAPMSLVKGGVMQVTLRLVQANDTVSVVVAS